MNPMTQEQAYQILVDAINLATTKGAYSLQDVSTVLSALQVLQPQPPVLKPEVNKKENNAN